MDIGGTGVALLDNGLHLSQLHVMELDMTEWCPTRSCISLYYYWVLAVCDFWSADCVCAFMMYFMLNDLLHVSQAMWLIQPDDTLVHDVVCMTGILCTYLHNVLRSQFHMSWLQASFHACIIMLNELTHVSQAVQWIQPDDTYVHDIICVIWILSMYLYNVPRPYNNVLGQLTVYLPARLHCRFCGRG